MSPARGLLHRDAATATALNRSKAAPASSSLLSEEVNLTHTPPEGELSAVFWVLHSTVSAGGAAEFSSCLLA